MKRDQKLLRGCAKRYCTLLYFVLLTLPFTWLQFTKATRESICFLPPDIKYMNNESVRRFHSVYRHDEQRKFSFANKLFVLENIEKTSTQKNKIILFIKKISLILLLYANSVN